MNTSTLADATCKLVESVFTLLRIQRANPSSFNEAARTTLERAGIALVAAEAALAQARESGEKAPRVPFGRPELHEEIFRLRAEGLGIRAIARRLGCNPSTVTRTLRRACEASAT
jgi:DNA-directed RNA polymerase specialized sigma24 family protein